MSRFKLSVASVATVLLAASMAFAAQPTITSISPNQATAGGAAFILTVTGSNFVNGASVQWNGANLPTSFLSSTQLRASVQATSIAAAGAASVTVWEKHGGTSNVVSFTINAAATTPPPATPLAVASTSVPIGTAGTAYSASLSATGGTAPYTWSVSSGTAPPGLTLSSAGALSGVPTTSGSYSFTAQVKDAASHTATYTYSLSVGAGTTVTLTIGPASVPSGTAGSAYTSTTLTASGGTAPYTWTQSSNIPGLALSSAGALSGTPTTAGSYTLSVAAKDALGNTGTKSFPLTVAAGTQSTPSGQLFTFNFDNGTMTGWDNLAASYILDTTTFYSAPASGNIHYVYCGDSTNAACGPQVFSQGGFFEKDFTATNGFPTGLQSFYFRGFVNHHVNAGGITTGDAGRKLYYLKSDPNYFTDGWAFVVTSFASSSGLMLTAVDEQPVAGLQVGGVTGNTWYSGAYMQFDQWACVELYLKPNTPGQSDGAFTLWLNGTPVLQQTGLDLRGNAANGIEIFEIGRQVSRMTWATIDEQRYWDNVVISTTGPIGCTTPP